MANAMTLKRIHREIADVRKEDLGNIVIMPSDDDLFLWKGAIPGPEGSCYEGGIFNVDVQLAPDYPFSAPKVTFTTRIYHMNISERGNVCIDILKQNWSPALSLFKVMLSLSSLLTDPNPKDPLVPSIATEFVRNRRRHDQTARQWTEMYALPKLPPPPYKATGTVVASKQHGKAKETQPIHEPPTAVSTSILVDTITIEDSDDEREHGRVSNPRRSARTAGQKRKIAGTIIDVDLTESGRGGGRAESSKRVASRTRNVVSSVLDVEETADIGSSRVGVSSGNRHKRSRNAIVTGKKPRRAEDVIVIDD